MEALFNFSLFCSGLFIMLISFLIIIIWLFKKKIIIIIIGLILFTISISIFLYISDIKWIKFKENDLIGEYCIDTALIDSKLMKNYKYQDCIIFFYSDNTFYISKCELQDTTRVNKYYGKGEWEIEDRNILYLHFDNFYTYITLKKKKFKTCIIFNRELDDGEIYEIIYTKIDKQKAS